MVFSVQDIRVERSTECTSGKLSLPIQEIELVVEKPQTLIRATQERKCERYPISLCIFDVVLWQLNRIKTQFSGCVTVCGSLELQKNKRRSCFEIEYLCISNFFIFPVCCFLFAFFFQQDQRGRAEKGSNADKILYHFLFREAGKMFSVWHLLCWDVPRGGV